MEEQDYMIKLWIARNREFSDFLQLRPNNEELGESLDLYERQLRKEGKLTETMEKEIRSCHLQYLSNLLDSDLPIKTLSEVNVEEDNFIQGFCEDLAFLYNANLTENHLRAFAEAYKSVSSPYVNYNMAKILLRYNIEDQAFDYYAKALSNALTSIDKYWNNKESIYACSELLFDVVSSEHFNSSTSNSVLHGNVLEYTYLLLSRVILWPEDEDSRFDQFDVPITYRHKISSLNKRAEILLKNKDYFVNLTPSYSTPEVLAVADYSLAHSYGFAGKQIGLKSLFKRDATKLYNDLSKDNIRPFSTAILDGKKDSVELAHRFYLKYDKELYQVDSKETTCLLQILLDTVNESHMPISKNDEKQIRQYLLENGIQCFYHFTERENIENIKKNGGICSLKYCLLNAIEVSTKGDMTLLRDADASFALEDYARLSFCKYHPLIKKRQAAGADLVLLKIRIDVAWRSETIFADRDAAKRHHHGGKIDDLKLIKMDAVHKSNLDEWDPDYDYNQAEVMVKSIVPIEYIINIDNPEEIASLVSASSGIYEITKNNLIKAIRTLSILATLFQNSSVLLSSNDGRNERKRRTICSFAGILGYLYEEIYRYGEFSSLVDSTMLQHYMSLITTLSEFDRRKSIIFDLAKNWSDILQTILEIQCTSGNEGKVFIELQSAIDNVTQIMESLSGSKCRRPTIGYVTIPEPPKTQFGRDTFTEMVEKAAYNPFEITAEPTLQKFPPLPDLYKTFKTELLSLYETTNLKELGHIQIFVLYVYGLVKSYYKNAGYVPKNTVDAMIEQCHKAIKETPYGWYIPSLDEMKYKIYRSLFSY